MVQVIAVEFTYSSKRVIKMSMDTKSQEVDFKERADFGVLKHLDSHMCTLISQEIQPSENEMQS